MNANFRISLAMLTSSHYILFMEMRSVCDNVLASRESEGENELQIPYRIRDQKICSIKL